MESGLIHLELKYCERCGALWLRLQGSEVVFCGNCAKALAEFPGWAGKTPAATARVSVFNDEESVFWGEGGHA